MKLEVMHEEVRMTTFLRTPPEEPHCPRCGGKLTYSGTPEATDAFHVSKSFTCRDGCGTRVRIYDLPTFKPCVPTCGGTMEWQGRAYECNKCNGVEMPAGKRP